jgi:hypothetical protein
MTRFGLILGVVGLLSSAALAAETKPPAHPEMTRDQRNKMAEAHQKMATCLRSDRPLQECRQEMMRACRDTMGADGCPMMDGMGHMKQGGQKSQTP